MCLIKENQATNKWYHSNRECAQVCIGEIFQQDIIGNSQLQTLLCGDVFHQLQTLT